MDNGIPPTSNLNTSLVNLPYTQAVNPIWEWDPCQPCNGVILEGSEVRRKYLDSSIAQYKQSYLKILINYNKL